jgi:iron(III) transport system permease protein
VRILEKMTELELGVAAAFSILVVVIVFIVITAISLFLRLFRQPGAPEMANILGG